MAEQKCIGELTKCLYETAFWKEGDEQQREEKSHFEVDTGGEARVLSEKAVVKKGPCGVCVCVWDGGYEALCH